MRGRFAVSVVVIVCGAVIARAAGPYALAPDETIELGRQIFEHNWAEPESWNGRQPLGLGGDGLGPMFNAVSCVACHQQGGTGGAGANERNVELLSVALKRAMPKAKRDHLLDQAHLLHPFFTRENSSFVLHRYGFSTEGDLLNYTDWRDSLTGRNDPHGLPLTIDEPWRSVGVVPLELAHRNTPPLWGLGLIEQIRIDDGRLRRRDLARLQRRSKTAVSGRVPKTSEGDHGWYGWRGQVGDLKEFVLNACANELGLEVPKRSQPANPLTEPPPQTRKVHLDLTRRQVTALTAYIAHLPRPVRIEPDDPEERQAAVDGERLFQLIGCAECHVDAVSSVEGLYSDLLLHDMGSRTSDQSTSIPERTTPARKITRRVGGYSGGSIAMTIPSQVIPSNTDQEWRTPPLWGVADSAPYFHDGRAPTLDDAIQLHEGEAAFAAQEYNRLSDENRKQLLAFLGTLRAPPSSAQIDTGQP